MAEKKKIQLCFLETCCTGGYMASGQWRRSTDNGKTKDTLKYYTDLAKLTKRGGISCIFFADWYAGFEEYGDSMDAMLKAGHHVAHLDPIPIITAMAACTESVSFAATASTSYVNLYILARQFSTLDHLTSGRVGWDIVTSWSKAAAQALGQDDVIPHDERYAVADEYMDVVYKLWESSWADDSVVWSNDTAFEPSEIKKVEHKGKYFKMSGRSQIHPSKQRTPVLFQAGTSKTGAAFAVKHAEAIFLNLSTFSQAKKVIAEARAAAAAMGRDLKSLKFFLCIVPIIGRIEKEAKEKYDLAVKNADIIGGLGQFSGYTGIDMSIFPLDEPFTSCSLQGGSSIQSVLTAFESSTSASGFSSDPWTPRKLGLRTALGGLHPCPVGSIEQVADVFEEWFREADCDGFSVAYVSNPGSCEDIVDLLRPELVRRGLMEEQLYGVKGGTFRENLFGRPGQTHLSEDHYGSSFKWGHDRDFTME